MSNYIDNTKAREYCFKFFYNLEKDLLNSESSLSENEVNDMIEDFDQLYFEPDTEHPDNILPPAAKKMALKLIHTIAKNTKELYPLIESLMNKKPLKSLDKVCVPLLFSGTSEIKFFKDTPKSVIINDSINIAKKYGTPEIASFINGVLDKVK